MRAVVVERPGVVKVDDVPEPKVGPTDVLIQVAACGICGTDVHIIDGEFPPATYPIVPGHEFSGPVVAVGAAVAGVTVGDRVGVDATLNCGRCYFCLRGPQNLCENWNAIGCTKSGGFAEYVVVPERTVYQIPDAISFAEAALLEPIGCVVHGFDVLRPRLGDSYLIYGAGPMGLLNAQLARYHGARTVAIVDVNPNRLDRAREFGFDVVGASVAEVRYVAPRGFNDVIEATGKTAVAERAIDAVIRRGKLLLFGVCPPTETAAFNAFKIFNEQLSILGTMALLNSYGPALDVLAAGAVDGKRMVTHVCDLERFPEAIALVRQGVGLKVQIRGSVAGDGARQASPSKAGAASGRG